MKEFEYKDFSEGLVTGLRAFKGNPINKQSLVTAFNVLTDESGLIPFEPVSAKATAGWFFNGKKVLLHLSSIGVLSTVNTSTWALTTVYTFPSNTASRLEVFDAGVFMLVSNGNNEYCQRTYLETYIAALPNSAGDYTYNPTLVFPNFKTICYFRGQAVAGNITAGPAQGNYGDPYMWDDCDDNCVAWSDIGKFNFRPTQQNTEGYRRMEWRGSVLKVKELGNSIIVYGTGGAAILNPITGGATTFGYKPLDVPGLVGAEAIAGNEHIHVFISKDKEVWKMGKDMLPKVLGYQEWIEALTASEIRISFDSKRKRFYISDTSRCFVLTSFGLTECYQNIRSVEDIEGTIIGAVTTDATPDTSVDILTDTIDYGQRSLKHLEFLEYGVRGNVVLEAYIHWRNNRGSFNVGSDITLNDQSIARVGITAQEFRLGFKAASYAGVYLSYIKQRIKLIDKRSIRGNYNANQS